MTRNLAALFAAVASSGLLVACGGGSDSAAVAPTPPPPVGPRGSLISSGKASTISTATIDDFGSVRTNGPVLPGERATCAVSIRQIVYATIDPAGRAVAASAGLLVPTGAGCLGAHPLLSAQHGTSTSAAFDGSDPGGTLPLTTARYFASHGYVVIIPDYLGYGASRNYVTYHPYVHAASGAATVMDAVRATRNWFGTSTGAATGVTLDGHLFLFGTSEGGYITMAAQRSMQSEAPAEFPLTAVVPTSGPYNLGAEVLMNLSAADVVGDSNTGSATFLLTSYQQVYGDVYDATTDAFLPPWSASVATLFPGTYGSDTAAIRACKIPFNVHTAPSPVPNECSAVNGASNPLLQPVFVADYIARTPGSRGASARARVDANDLVSTSWDPAAPTTLCYGSLDLPAEANALAAGVSLGLPPANVVDVQSTGPSYITSWMSLASQTDAEYHGQVEAPGCTAYARYAVFDRYVAPL